MWVYSTRLNYYYVIRLYLITHENSLHLSWILFDIKNFLTFTWFIFALLHGRCVANPPQHSLSQRGGTRKTKKKQITNILWKKAHAIMRPGLEFVIKNFLCALSYAWNLFIYFRYLRLRKSVTTTRCALFCTREIFFYIYDIRDHYRMRPRLNESWR